ncbi:MAG TPA: diadenylate cyclase CdaA [Spirochaetota bacterium]|nr:diadenylate cyclase CdaA [Spirochaetota bacterium]HOL56600.1 diadenylate cyclase CdaA [Spirochaetota bacterium]HPP04023.1 diadenylate cyclase CdaA [Spirochaetota bacterium]
MLLLRLPVWIIIINVILSFIDIFIIALFFYSIYKILSQTKAVQVIRGLLFFIFIYLISRFARLETFSWLLDQIASVIVLAVIILFQPELRRVLTKIGQSNWFKMMIKKDPKELEEILKAINHFNILHIGALIVFERNVGLKNIIESGTIINSKISAQLLITIFTYKTPLHDGAVIIKNDQIVAAGCFLPLSESTQIGKDFGTRHRAALGLAEESDAVIVVVSEETGKISLAFDGKLYTNYDIDVLRKELTSLLGYEEIKSEDIIDEKN